VDSFEESQKINQMERSKDMKALIIWTLSLLVSSGAFANDFAVAVGIRSNGADALGPGTVNSKTGFGAGAIGFFDVGPNFQLRSGFLYNQRNFTATSGGVDTDLNMAYVDIPVTAMYKFADYAGVFAGPVLALLASKECKSGGSSCSGTLPNPQAMSMGLQLGASFKFAPQLGGEFYYEVIPSTFWKSTLENAKTVGANFLITFE
jgi:hypothetical protein